MKRFTATEKWGKEWFQNLPCRLKCFWSYLCDNVDPAGVWEPNFKLASFQIGETVTATDIEAFDGRVVLIEGGKLLIVGFVAFQFGRLSAGCKAHIPVFRVIEKHRLCNGYAKAIHSLQEADTDTEKEKEEEKRGSAEGAKRPDSGSPDWREVATYATTTGLAEWKARDWWNEMEGCGWLDYSRRPIRKWKPVMDRIRAKWEADGRPSGPPAAAGRNDTDLKHDKALHERVNPDLNF